MHSATAIPRMPASFARRRAAACLALAGLACLVLAACSPGADYPSLFPSVHDIPPPRSDIRLDQNQVQQATEDLITARDRLTAEAQSAQAKSATGSTVKPATKSLSQSPAKSAASSAGKPSASKSSTGKSSAGESSGNLAAGAAQASSRQTLGTDAGQAAAGAETK